MAGFVKKLGTYLRGLDMYANTSGLMGSAAAFAVRRVGTETTLG